eukprot:TRINITY_DN8083_c1_g1_i1.p1 TRINITY_DN8083_c1_g1~~TRINITY_DN8083_c1_g1_i1.p1  ORF type:complete len:642 (-),score=125.51 TRINITY_DN8083_c1_g1_i1:136-2061(-)
MDPDEPDEFDMQGLLKEQLVVLERALDFNKYISERLVWQSSLLRGPPSPPPKIIRRTVSIDFERRTGHDESPEGVLSWQPSPLPHSLFDNMEESDRPVDSQVVKTQQHSQDSPASGAQRWRWDTAEPPEAEPPEAEPPEAERRHGDALTAASPGSHSELSAEAAKEPDSNGLKASADASAHRPLRHMKEPAHHTAEPAHTSVMDVNEHRRKVCRQSVKLLEGQLDEPLLKEGEGEEEAAGEKTAKKESMSIHEMRRLVAEHLYDPPVEESDHYRSFGLPQAIARSAHFHQLAIFAVISNIIWLGIDMDYSNSAPLDNEPSTFLIVDNIYCAFFVFEVAIRFLAFADKAQVLQETRFMFDFALVIMTVWESWLQPLLNLVFGSSGINGQGASALRILRILRVGRTARTFRLVGLFPELRILAKAFVVAVRSAFAIGLFLALVIYVFGLIFFDQLSHEKVGEDRFQTVLQSLNFLLLQVLCGFDAGLINELLAGHLVCYILYLVFLFVTSLALMNMLTGVICNVISAASELEEYETQMIEVHEELGRVLRSIDADGNDRIDWEEMEQLMNSRHLVRCLKDQGIDVVGLMDFMPFLYRDANEIKLSELLETLVGFQGAKPATVRDLVEMRMFLTEEMRRISESD